MRPLLIVMALLAMPELAVATDAARFSGNGALGEGAVESQDGRYTLNAELEQGDAAQRGGRFALDARLAVGDLAKSANAVCTTVDAIFKNGFD